MNDSHTKEEAISLQEYPKIIRDQGLWEHYPGIITILLNQYLKKLLRQEGVNEESDDVFRPLHFQ